MHSPKWRAALARGAVGHPPIAPPPTAPSTSPCIRRPQTWLWRPLAALAGSSAAQVVLPPFVAGLLQQVQFNELYVLSICSLALITGCEQTVRVFRLAGSKQVGGGGRQVVAGGWVGACGVGDGGGSGCKQAALVFCLAGSMQVGGGPEGQGRVDMQGGPGWVHGRRWQGRQHRFAASCFAVLLRGPPTRSTHLNPGSTHHTPSNPQLDHTTLPKREHGHKQLGKGAAAAHLLQMVLLFGMGAAMLLLASKAPGQGRVAMGTFGVIYALQVRRQGGSRV